MLDGKGYYAMEGKRGKGEDRVGCCCCWWWWKRGGWMLWGWGVTQWPWHSPLSYEQPQVPPPPQITAARAASNLNSWAQQLTMLQHPKHDLFFSWVFFSLGNIRLTFVISWQQCFLRNIFQYFCISHLCCMKLDTAKGGTPAISKRAVLSFSYVMRMYMTLRLHDDAVYNAHSRCVV